MFWIRFALSQVQTRLPCLSSTHKEAGIGSFYVEALGVGSSLALTHRDALSELERIQGREDKSAGTSDPNPGENGKDMSGWELLILDRGSKHPNLEQEEQTLEVWLYGETRFS